MTSIEPSVTTDPSPVLPKPSKIWGPWSPTLLMVITLLFATLGSGSGLLASGLLAAMNWCQLGFKRHDGRCGGLGRRRRIAGQLEHPRDMR